MYQRWRQLTFLHWRYDRQAIEAFIPAQLKLDVFEGAAWVGVAPFIVCDLRPPWAPVVPWISRFPETNVRTYVRGPDGGRGVWFFTLEADRLAAVMAARTVYHLPYRWAAMKVKTAEKLVHYTSERKKPFGHGRTDIVVEPGDAIVASERDHFLTARFRLYAVAGHRVFSTPIEHEPWPLRSAEVSRLEQDLIEACGLPTAEGEPLVHYSADLQVKIGKIEQVG
jgi:uncharacterized protein YqjF (DUF2071 family)